MGLIMALGEAWGPGTRPRLVSISVAPLCVGSLLGCSSGNPCPRNHQNPRHRGPQGFPVHSVAKTFCWNFLPAEGHPSSSGGPRWSLMGGVPRGPFLLGRNCGLYPLGNRAGDSGDAESLPSWVTSGEKEENFPECFGPLGGRPLRRRRKPGHCVQARAEWGAGLESPGMALLSTAALSSDQGEGATGLVLGTGLALSPGSTFNSSVTDEGPLCASAPSPVK